MSQNPVETISFRLTGTRPILLHNCQPSLDPFNKMRREMRNLTSKTAKTKTDDDHERISYLEFRMGLYLDDEGGVVIPSVNLERMLRDGAAAARQGKNVQAGVTVVQDAPLLDGLGNQYRDPDKLWNADGGKRHRDLRAVKVQSARVLRTRPIFREWSLVMTAMFMPSVVDRDVLIEALNVAGLLKCLGDNRPRYGSFSVEVVE